MNNFNYKLISRKQHYTTHLSTDMRCVDYLFEKLQNNMKTIKKYLKQIFKLFLFRIIIVQLLRNKLINRRFKNLIE